MDISTLVNTSQILDIVLKWGFVTVLVICALFAILIYRQVQLMSRTLAGLLEPMLKAVAG